MSVAIIILLCALAQSQFGIGLLAFGTPLLLLSGMEFTDCLLVLLPCSICLSILQLIEGRGSLEKKQYYRAGILVPATIVGLLAWKFFSSEINIKHIVGWVMLISAFLSVAPVISPWLRQKLRMYQNTSLFFIGVIHGVCNMGGALLTFYSSSVNDTKTAIRTQVAVGYLVMAIIQLVTIMVLRDWDVFIDWHWPLLTVAVYVIGGRKIFVAMGENVFRKAIQIVVVALALVSIST